MSMDWHTQARVWALPAIALTGLVAGLALMASPRSDWAVWGFAAGIVPVLTVLVWSIVRSLARGELGLDFIAGLAMAGALVAGEALAGAVVALMYAGGQWLEAFAQGRAGREMTALLARVARTAQRYDGPELTETPIEALKPGDRLMIRAGEVIPADGRVVAGVAVLDESSLTGEPLPVHRRAGEEVLSGVANAGAAFDLEVTRPAAESTYAGIVRLVDSARTSRAPMARLADRYALGFLAATLLLAGLAWALTGDATRALAVLVVATPCPLILAVPVAIVSGMSSAARHGLLIKAARTLETLAQVRTLLIDKTGTLTVGVPTVTTIEPVAGVEGIDLVQAAAALAQASQHTISQALVTHARADGLDLVAPSAVVETPGDGLAGTVGRQTVVIGRHDYVVRSLGLDPSPPAATIAPGIVALTVGIDGRLAGRILFVDTVRSDARATLDAMRVAGVRRIVLLTGDITAIADTIGRTLGVDRVIAEATPAGKVEAVRAAGSDGPVMMVGDGLNDAPALAIADIGVAMGARGAAAAAEAADIVVLVDSIARLRDGMAIAARTRRIALESVAIGLGLSVAGMIAAAFGYLTPLAGAILQEAIDVAVILNALRALASPPGLSR